MKIDSLSPNPLSSNPSEGAGQVKNSGHADQGSRVQGAGASDRADLSDRARLLAKARTSFQNTPDINQEKVADVKKRVDSGTYSIPTDQLVRRLLHRLNQIPPE
jgi:flagellar biosynthesis anti-sigma factor FlgM